MILKSKLTKRVFAVLLVVGLAVGSAAAASTVTVKNIQANYEGIKIVVDGVEITPKDVTGAVVEPFTCDGTTYLPVRAIANALGKQVDWDGETKTVYIGEIPGQETNWMIKLPPYMINSLSRIYDGSDPHNSFNVSGVDHTTGLVLADHYNGIKVSPYALWNTNGQYKSMTFTVGFVTDAHAENATLDIYLDNTFYKSYDLHWDRGTQTITVPLNNALNVKFSMNDSSYDGYAYGFYDISFQCESIVELR